MHWHGDGDSVTGTLGDEISIGCKRCDTVVSAL